MAGVTNREFWDFRVKTRAQFTKLAEQIANIDTSGGGGISELTSKMVVDALGYTPYNANNPANYITSAALAPYLKTEDAEETYATKDYVTTKLVDYAPLTSVQGFENRIGGLESAVPQLNNRVTTVEGKVSSLNETVSTGENNLLDRVNVIEEEYATKTYVDNAIGGIDLSPYLKTEDAKETYATKDFVNNKLINYATIVSVTAIQNTLTGQIGAVGVRVDSNDEQIAILNETTSGHTTSIGTLTQRVDSVEQLASTKLDSSYFTLTNIKSTLGISDWALAATKPSYAWSEITSRPTALSQFTDDVVAGKYLPLSGGTLSNAAWRSQLTIERSGSANDSVIAFKNSNGLLGCLGYRGADGIPCVWLGETGTGVPIIHANNIGSYNAGSADSANKLNAEYLADLNNGTSGRLFYSAFQAANTPPGANYFAGLTFGNESIKQIAMSYYGNLYTRYYTRHSNTPMWSNWKEVAFTDSNVASATKLQTSHTLWGQSFDGTKDITLGLNLDGYKSTGTVSQISDLGDKGLVVSVDDKRNNYGMAFWIEGNCKGYIQQQAFGSSTTYSLCIQPFGGNVGIGTTSPTERLDVSGNIKASGNINATSITINGVTITASNGSITVNGNVLATGDITGGV